MTMMEAQLTGAEEIRWDLSPLYAGADDPAIEADMQKLDALADELAKEYRGKIADLDAAGVAAMLDKLETVYDLMGRLSNFAYLLYSTDSVNPAYGALVQRVTEFSAAIGQKLVFFQLEWNAVPDAQANAILADPAVAKVRHFLEAERRFKPYQLSEAEEKTLLEKSVTGNSAWTRFFDQSFSAMRFDYEGEQLNLEQVLTKLHERDRETRKKAHASLTAGLKAHALELTYIFNVLLADKASDDRLRGFDTWVSSRNLDNKVSDEVVEALIEAVTSRYDLVARHYRLKRALLGLDALYDYDRYAPLPIKQSEKFYTWEQARKIVLDAFTGFSPKMAEVAARFFDERWIDAPPQPNKRGGAYSSSVVPSVHPYVFMNYQGKANDVSTLAHELGHGVHQYLAGQEQGIFGMDTPLTTAEMASTFAEMLVFTDLMQREEDPEARLAMLAEKIEGTFATVYRQIAMNRFEDGMHTARRAEGELPNERFTEIWLDTQRAMFGDSVTITDEYGIWWSYIPHFLHVPGYVYAYSFGELLVLALFELYKERGESFVPQYIEVLAAGDSDYPHEILAKLGVDLNDPAFWHKGLDALEALITQEEQLAKEVYPDRVG